MAQAGESARSRRRLLGRRSGPFLGVPDSWWAEPVKGFLSGLSASNVGSAGAGLTAERSPRYLRFLIGSTLGHVQTCLALVQPYEQGSAIYADPSRRGCRWQHPKPQARQDGCRQQGAMRGRCQPEAPPDGGRQRGPPDAEGQGNAFATRYKSPGRPAKTKKLQTPTRARARARELAVLADTPRTRAGKALRLSRKARLGKSADVAGPERWQGCFCHGRARRTLLLPEGRRRQTHATLFRRPEAGQAVGHACPNFAPGCP